MKALRDKFPGRAIKQHGHCNEFLVARTDAGCGGRLGGKPFRMPAGGNTNWIWRSYSLRFRGRYETEVFGSEPIAGKDVPYSRSGLGAKRSIILRIFVRAFIKEQYSRKSRARLVGNRAGRELLTIQENLEPKLIEFRSRGGTRRFGRFLLLDRSSYRNQFCESRYP